MKPLSFGGRNRWVAAIAGGVLLLCLIGWIFSAAHFYRSLLVGWFFCLTITLGGLWLVMLHHLVGGGWGFLIRRFCEGLIATFPLLAIVGVILATGFSKLFPWADPSFWPHDAILLHRRPWLSCGWVFARGALLFATWIYLAFRFRSNSLKQDRGDAPARRQYSLGLLSRGGMVLGFVTVSLASIDWVMSREPHWYSTAFGLVLISSQGLCGCAAAIVILWIYKKHPAIKSLMTPDRLQDLGNLLMTTLVLWAYIAFAQFLVIWMGNMQEEIVYIHQRTSGGWHVVVASIIVLNFSLPLAALLSQEVKRDLDRLVKVAFGILVMQLVFTFWLIAPSSRTAFAGGVFWTDLVVPPVMLVAWMATAAFFIRRAAPVPAYQPETMISPKKEHGPEARLAAE